MTPPDQSGTADLDLGRLDALAAQLDRPRAEIAATLLDELDRSIAGVLQATAADALPEAALAAHAARNSAMMLDARPLLVALGAIEEAARAGRPEQARAAEPSLSQAWGTLRVRLARAAA